MFCFQCEQTSKGEGCTKIGVCGKQPEVAALQDLLVYALKGLSQYAIEGRKVGVNDPEVDRFTSKALFSTLTNVDFDPTRFVELINETVKRREAHKEKVRSAGGKTGFTEGPAVFKPESSLEAMIKQGEKVGVKSDPDINPDILSLRELLVYGLKGAVAYADHAAILGHQKEAVNDFMMEALASTTKDLTVDQMVALVMKAGDTAVATMALLDEARASTGK